jgi:hypothetical protein
VGWSLNDKSCRLAYNRLAPLTEAGLPTSTSTSIGSGSSRSISDFHDFAYAYTAGS